LVPKKGEVHCLTKKFTEREEKRGGSKLISWEYFDCTRAKVDLKKVVLLRKIFSQSLHPAKVKDCDPQEGGQLRTNWRGGGAKKETP